MGSEESSAVTIHVTGFKKFYGVSENPTETIVRNLAEFMQRKGLPTGLVLGSCNILETAGEGALDVLHNLFEHSVAGRDDDASNRGEIIWLHLGVHGGATIFYIENQAVNQADFCCPDELGWEPQGVPILPSDGSISQIRKTSIPVNDIVKALSEKGYNAMPSDDAGLFVCNFVYYHSLWFAQKNKIKSLFVHVPPFSAVKEEIQMEFVATLLELLASLNY